MLYVFHPHGPERFAKRREDIVRESGLHRPIHLNVGGGTL
jgi:hypothetical protein